MTKIFKNLLLGLCMVFIAWMIVSWVDIVADNCEPNPVHSPYNLFVLLFDEDEPEAKPEMDGQCGDPMEVLRGTTGFIKEMSETGIIFETADGNTWYTEPGDTSAFDPNGYYVIMFDTMGTEDINDDQILKTFVEVW